MDKGTLGELSLRCVGLSGWGWGGLQGISLAGSWLSPTVAASFRRLHDIFQIS